MPTTRRRPTGRSRCSWLSPLSPPELGACLLAAYGAGPHREVAAETDHEGDGHTEVRVGPRAVATTEAERLEQVAEPRQSLAGARGVDDEAPADERRDQHGRDRGDVDRAVAVR